MTTQEKIEIKPLDYSILDGFTFVHGAGNYATKTVCAMTALYLLTQIALDKTSLPEAIMTEAERDALDYDKRQGLRVIEPHDRVSCVSDQLRDLVVNRNDCDIDPAARKDWALSIMPRILNTKLGRQTITRAYTAVEKLSKDAFVKAKREELAAEFARTQDPEIERHLKSLDSGYDDEWSERIRVAWIDLKIETSLAVYDRARAGRAKRMATLAQKSRNEG